MTDATDLMRKAIETFEARSSYGPADFKKQGEIMHALFPAGMQTLTVEQCSRFVVLSIIVTKLCRYAEHAHDNGHDDSIHDIGVYAFILQAMDIASREGLVDISAFRDAVNGIKPQSAPELSREELTKNFAETADRAALPDYAIDRWVEIPATDNSPLAWEGYPRKGANIYRIGKVLGQWRYRDRCTKFKITENLATAKRECEGVAIFRGETG